MRILITWTEHKDNNEKTIRLIGEGRSFRFWGCVVDHGKFILESQTKDPKSTWEDRGVYASAELLKEKAYCIEREGW